jgi:hypothetical protein
MPVFTVTALCRQAYYADIQIAASTCSENPNVHRPYLKGSSADGSVADQKRALKHGGIGNAVRFLTLLLVWRK